MRILVPERYASFLDEINNCLVVAGVRGLATSHINPETGSGDLFLVESDEGFQSIKLGLYEEYRNGFSLRNADLCLDYSSSLLGSPTGLDTDIKSGVVALGVRDGRDYLDIWKSSNGIEAIKYAENRITQDGFERHFCWFITLLALGFPIEDCLVLARASMNVSRETWPDDYEHLPIPVLKHSIKTLGAERAMSASDNSFPDIEPHTLGLYPVVDSVEWIEKLLNMGVRTMQLRIKDVLCADLEEQIELAVKLGASFGAKVFINDHWELALKYNAYGVHLGQEDIVKADLQRISEAGCRLGLSTHGYYELLKACLIEPSYIALGHIFPTTTKVMPSKPQGLTRLGLYQSLVDSHVSLRKRPVATVAIGGIDRSNAQDVLNRGVSSLAVVRAITLSESPRQEVEWFNKLMNDTPVAVPRVREDANAN